MFALMDDLVLGEQELLRNEYQEKASERWIQASDSSDCVPTLTALTTKTNKQTETNPSLLF